MTTTAPTATAAGGGARWFPLRILADVLEASLEEYPGRTWNSPLVAEVLRAVSTHDGERLTRLAAAVAWGLHEITPWNDLHMDGIVRESLLTALSAVETLGTRPLPEGELEAALDNLKGIFSHLRREARDLAPLAFLFLSLVASLSEKETRVVDVSLRTLRDLGASARMRAEALAREANAIQLADTSPDAQRRRESDWAARADGATREAQFWRYEVEKSRRKNALSESAAALRRGAGAASAYSEFISALSRSKARAGV